MIVTKTKYGRNVKLNILKWLMGLKLLHFDKVYQYYKLIRLDTEKCQLNLKFKVT